MGRVAPRGFPRVRSTHASANPTSTASPSISTTLLRLGARLALMMGR